MLLPSAKRLVSEPSVEPVDLDGAKRHLRIDHDDEDTDIEEMIVAVRQDAEATITLSAFISQQWEASWDDWPPVMGYDFELPSPPLISVDSITYYDTDGQQQTVAVAKYRVTNAGSNSVDYPGRIDLVKNVWWPTVDCRREAVTVTFTAGYGAAATDVPVRIRRGLLLLIGDLYRFREGMTEKKLQRLPVAARLLGQRASL